MATPLINPLRVNGGTFYTFSSAVKDIQKTFTDDDARFVFSKFVLLDIPNVATPNSVNHENYVVWESIGAEAGQTGPSISTDNNVNIAQSFQNYVLNFEEEILQGTNTLAQPYDSSALYSVAERIFWKWMTQINAIRFREATASEAISPRRYTEENPTQFYNRIVKYIGDIDIVNNVSRNGHAYSEVYMNVPTQHGTTPLILWKTYSDNNYSPSRTWTNGNEFIAGRDSGSTHPSGLSLNAYYDNEINNSYTTKSTFGLVGNSIRTAKTVENPAGKIVKISAMDGAILDFNPLDYSPIVNDGNISSFTEFNATDAANDFRFNACLVYYDTYSASNSSNVATNLYGILILDDFVNEGNNISYLKRFDKFKPNKITKLNGNSYSLKLDIKFDSTVANAGVETLINDYNTFSMDLFIDASTRLQEAAEMFIKTELDLIEIKKRLDDLSQRLATQNQIDTLAQRVSELEASLNNAKMAFQSSTTLLDLINTNADNINSILSGNLSIDLTYNTDVLKSGDGIFLDRSVRNQISVSNKIQAFNNFSSCSNNFTIDNPESSLVFTPGNGNDPMDVTRIFDNNILSINNYTNYYRQKSTDHITLDDGIDIMADNLIININDNPIRWKTGQLYRIVFDDPIDLNQYSIFIKTDSTNRFGMGNYGMTIGAFDSTKLISNRPIIDIICIDENEYKFNIDIIR